MPRSNTHFELWENGSTQQWHWRLRAGNGEIVAHGEAYTTRSAARRAITIVKRTNAATEVEEIEAQP